MAFQARQQRQGPTDYVDVRDLGNTSTTADVTDYVANPTFAPPATGVIAEQEPGPL